MISDPVIRPLVGRRVKRLALASIASAVPMGQQSYEESIAVRAADVLDPSWDVERTVIRSLRSPLQGTVRLPSRVMSAGSLVERRLVGAVIHRGSDLVHRLDLRIPPAPAPEILTVHDVAPWRFPDEAALPEAVAVEARRSGIVICPSQFAADEVTAVLGVRTVEVIPNGVSDEFFEATPLSDSELSELGLRRPFVIHAGGCSLRKNLAALAAAWPSVSQVHPEASLALLGPPDHRRNHLFGGMKNTTILGRIPPNLVPRIMASAGAVAVPSIYEGFGLPAIEAMATGTPVVAANRASLPEICGDAAILVEPSASPLADGIVAALDAGPGITDAVERGRERAQLYSWAASASAHGTVWRSLGI